MKTSKIPSSNEFNERYGHFGASFKTLGAAAFTAVCLYGLFELLTGNHFEDQIAENEDSLPAEILENNS